MVVPWTEEVSGAESAPGAGFGAEEMDSSQPAVQSTPPPAVGTPPPRQESQNCMKDDFKLKTFGFKTCRNKQFGRSFSSVIKSRTFWKMQLP